MKTIYKSIIITVAGLSFTFFSSAQNNAEKDTVYNRHILLEKEFNPTLQDAAKINTLPAVHEPVVKQANIEYETQQPGLSLNSFPVGDTGSGDIATSIDYSKKRGYFTFAGGNYLNLKGSLGYRILNTKEDKLDIFARHNSTNGDIKYAEKNYTLDEAKAKYMNNLFKASYEHSFEFLSWYLNGSFENTSFNYYGNPFDINNSIRNYDLNKKQTVNNFGIETGIVSSDNNEFMYDAYLKFNHFTNKYGFVYDMHPNIFLGDGADGNIIDGKFHIATPFGADKHIGVRLGILNQTFSNKRYSIFEDELHSLTKLQFNPYFTYEGNNFTAKVGINVNYAFDKKNKFAIAPDVDFSWQFADKTSLYLKATGGINDNNYLYILQENRYITPQQRIEYSYTIADATIGVKSGIVEGVEFDIFAGYKYTEDEHLYVANNFMDLLGNTSSAYYYDLGVGHIGGLIKTSLIPYTDLSAQLKAYFYNVEDAGNLDGGNPLKKAWNLPSFTFNLNADINPIDRLIISASYNLATGRKAHIVTEEGAKSMKNINELNFRGEYALTDWLSVNVYLNNLLNQKYDTWYGYTHQGFNILGGVSLKF